MVSFRSAEGEDVAAVIDFARRVIPRHYESLIGSVAASRQVTDWWTAERLGDAAAAGRLILAEIDGVLAGVAEWGVYEGVPVIWKLYVGPEYRGQGIGRQLLQEVQDRLPAETDHVQVEHFAANERAERFYEREGFRELRIESHAEDPRLDVVWREKPL